MSSPFHLFSRLDSSVTLASTLTDDTSPPPDMESSSEDITARPMKLKVLYTFDEENKTNCLARWPHVLDIRTATVDETTEIGVIELKTCIQAIVQASPELVAKLGHDYTIYAYDYSEYETPLVGQGMLSWALASTSPTPNAPAHQSSTIVTGLVCKNILGIFSKGVSETLEVKLRLVPVPTVLQSEYLASMQKYREVTNAVGPHFDHQAWTNFVQTNPAFFAGNNRPSSQRSSATSVDRLGLHAVQQLLSENASPQDTTSMQPILQPSHTPQYAISRASTPVMNSTSTTQRRVSDVQASRPSSRASVRGSSQPLPQLSTRRKGSISGEYASTDETPDEGPAKKRAKVTKADWPASSVIEKQPESLRVAAGNAASVRTLYRPIASNPTNNPANNLPGSQEEPVRPPTPISKPANTRGRRSRPTPSNLRQESLSQEVPVYVSPYAVPPAEQPPVDSALPCSPEKSMYGGSISNTPANIPSSPPVWNGLTSGPATPQLPPLRKGDHDSGFASGNVDSFFGHDEFPPLNDDDWQGALLDEEAQHVATFPEATFKHMMPGPPEDLPQTMPRQTFNHITRRAIPANAPLAPLPDTFSEQPQGDTQQPLQSAYPPTSQAPLRPISRHSPLPAPQPVSQLYTQPQITVTATSRPPSRAGTRPQMLPPLAPLPPGGRPLVRTQSAGSLPSPLVAASDPVQPQPSRLQRSQTITEASQHPASDAPTSSKDAKPRGGSRSGLKRSKQIQERLESCIGRGEMPPFCENCGQIETPTWRRAYGKPFRGGVELAQQATEDPSVLCWEPLEVDESNNMTLFRVIRKFVNLPDDGWTQITLCNPCGLWLFKAKVMRPEDKWTKKPKGPSEKRKRPPRKRSKKPNGNEANTESQAGQEPAAGSDASSPADGLDDAEEEFYDDEQELPRAKRVRAQSAEPSKSPQNLNTRWENQAAREAALQKAILSSPARFLGSESTPIQLDGSPSRARRLLFPSPRREGEMKTLDGALPGNRTSHTSLHLSPQNGAALQSIAKGSPTAVRRSPRRGHMLPPHEAGSPTALRRSPRLNKHIMQPNTEDSSPVDKENQPPGSEKFLDGFDDLFEDDGLMERPMTPTSTSESGGRNRFETPSPATQVANFLDDQGHKSAHVKQVMNMMKEPTTAGPKEVGNIAALIDGRGGRLSPFSRSLAESLRDACNVNMYVNQSPSKQQPRVSHDLDSPGSQPEDPANVDITEMEGLGPEFDGHLGDWTHSSYYDDGVFQDEAFGGIAGDRPQGLEDYTDADGQRWHEGTRVAMTAEEEKQRIEVLMGRA